MRENYYSGDIKLVIIGSLANIYDTLNTRENSSCYMIELTVGDVPTGSARTLAPETSVTEAAQTLRDPAVSALVVLDDEDAAVGIVAESNFVLSSLKTPMSAPWTPSCRHRSSPFRPPPRSRRPRIGCAKPA